MLQLNFDQSTDKEIIQAVRNSVNALDAACVRISVIRGKQKKGVNIMPRDNSFLTRRVMLNGGVLDLIELKQKIKEIADVNRRYEEEAVKMAA